MDHLLSMELLLIEKQPYETFGARHLNMQKVSRKATDFLLGFERLFLSIDFVLWKLDNAMSSRFDFFH